MMRPQPMIVPADERAMRRVADNDAVILEGPLLNPNSRRREVWLRGPEGYVVVVAGPPAP
jgi:hypothetical protein